MVAFIHREGSPYHIEVVSTPNPLTDEQRDHLDNSMRKIAESVLVEAWYFRQEYEMSFEPVEISAAQAYGNYSKHLDIKYPHVCFKYKEKLTFKELFNANRRKENYKKDFTFPNGDLRYLDFDMPLYRKLKALWRSQVVEFYCCKCFIDAKVDFIESCII